ncbi:unnamed protein product [Hermetia illucens]|uniref:Short-chain dehydrogenase/reductase 3 n=1 Tax=Hermetia illucens TaxID=343691 RepID=A0A7R8UGG8_HERIL|nr:17-beta-hydroxysteroid dehydrogenase 13 [Hermetia illucens]CAD7079582.1 unnamed protein product [Hermetia illucens]
MAMVKNDNDTTGRVYQKVVQIVEILVLFIKIFTEIFISTVKLFLGEKQKDVSGEIVLITGTGHGIGRELALQYAALGATVICVDINEAGNKETVREANSQGEGEAFGYVCDVSKREQVLEVARKVQKEVGSVSVLINNAGIMPTHSLEQHTPEEIRRVFDINVLSHFWTLEAFLPDMREKNRGHVVSISSIAGHVGLSNLVPYCASKFAVRGLLEALHEEYREKGITCIKTTCVSPYMVNTGLCKKPKVKFPGILGLQDPKDVASAIIEAQRKDLKDITIPLGLYQFGSFCRLFPVKCQLLIKDYIDSGVESDL